jgi:hypothetical protein
MQDFEFADTPYRPRRDLVEAERLAWRRLAEPGAWLTGPRRVAVAAEVRHAHGCDLCRRRKEALSPYAVDGAHDTLGALDAVEIDLVHRLVTDSGRLGEDWFQACLAGGLGEEEFVEIVSVVCSVMIVDTFARAIGAALSALPEPAGGEPSRYRAKNARRHDAWVSHVEPADVVPEDGFLYENGPQPPVIKALSLVPEAKRAYWELAEPHYLPYAELPHFDRSIRALSRPQLEIVAARTSALHQCVY